jgi:outer membrane protein assembly factor BamB
MISSVRFLAGSLSVFFVQAQLLASDWPQWRGPKHDGHVPAGERVPDELPAEPKVVWKMKVGEGLASPVVAGGKVFYFDNVGGKETLHALDAVTAKQLWRKEIDDTFSDLQGPTGPRCTPMVDDDRVYAQSCKGELQCLRAADGKLIWRVNYTNDFGAVFVGEKGNTPGASRHGNNGAPVVDGEFLYACAGGTNGAGIICFEKRTGKVVWKSQNDQAGYAPPIMATISGVKEIVCFTADGLIGLEVKAGKLLWRVPMKTAFARHVTTPVAYEDVVVVASHQIGLLGTRISKDGVGLRAEEAWLNKEAAMNFSSPVAVDQYLYGLGPSKNFVCVAIPTGKLMWSKDGSFTTSADKAHASFIVMGKNILTLTDGGQLVLFAAGPQEFREIGRAQVCGMNWCNPAYADGKLYWRDGIKGAGELACVELVP